MSNLIIYHAHCLDGTTAAAVALEALGHADLYADSYGSQVPRPDVTGKSVYIVDFSYPRDILVEMAKEAKKLVVLDHHRTAERELKDLPYAVFDMERSGAGITWDYFHHDGESYPPVVAHVQDRDLWRFDLDGTRQFCSTLQYELDRLDTPDDKVRAVQMALNLSPTEVESMTKDGQLLTDSFNAIVDNICEQAYEVELLGVRMLCVNAPGKFASEAGNVLAHRCNGAACVWYSDGHELKISLRSVPDVDVSEIASAFGGGGHKNAAGFRAGLLFFREIGVALAEDIPPEAANETGIRVWNVNEPTPDMGTQT